MLGWYSSTEWVSLLARVYTYQFNLLFVGTKELSNNALAVLVYLALGAFVSRNTCIINSAHNDSCSELEISEFLLLITWIYLLKVQLS